MTGIFQLRLMQNWPFIVNSYCPHSARISGDDIGHNGQINRTLHSSSGWDVLAFPLSNNQNPTGNGEINVPWFSDDRTDGSMLVHVQICRVPWRNYFSDFVKDQKERGCVSLSMSHPAQRFVLCKHSSFVCHTTWCCLGCTCAAAAVSSSGALSKLQYGGT